MNTPIVVRRAVAASLIVLALAVLAGCGSDRSDKSSGASPGRHPDLRRNRTGHGGVRRRGRRRDTRARLCLRRRAGQPGRDRPVRSGLVQRTVRRQDREREAARRSTAASAHRRRDDRHGDPRRRAGDPGDGPSRRRRRRALPGRGGRRRQQGGRRVDPGGRRPAARRRRRGREASPSSPGPGCWISPSRPSASRDWPRRASPRSGSHRSRSPDVEVTRPTTRRAHMTVDWVDGTSTPGTATTAVRWRRSWPRT